MKRAAILAGVAVAIISGPAAAQRLRNPPVSDREVEARRSPQYNRCMATGDAARGVTLGLMNCSGEENSRQDRRLNAAYVRVMGKLSPAAKARLRTDQRAWIRIRDRTCQAQADRAGGGTLSGVIFSNCFGSETIRRTIWLERYRP